ECRVDDGEVDLGEDVVPLANEAIVLEYVHLDVGVAVPRSEPARMPFAGEADALPVVNALRDLDLEAAFHNHATGPLTRLAVLLDATTGAVAVRARRLPDELAEDTARDVLQDPGPTAAGADHRARSRSGAVATARSAGDGGLDRHRHLAPVRSLDEGDLDLGEHVGPASRCATAPSAAEQVLAEERREEVAERVDVEVCGLEATRAQAGVPVPVVELAGLGGRERLVRLGRLAEPSLGLRAVGDAGVQLAGELAEGLLDLLVARRPRDAEYLVVVALCCRHGPLSCQPQRPSPCRPAAIPRRRPLRRTGTARGRRRERREAPSRSPSAAARGGSPCRAAASPSRMSHLQAPARAAPSPRAR